MKVHISLNVSDIECSVAFYEKMLGTKPVKYIVPNGREGFNSRQEGDRPGYAKFDIENPPLNLVLNEAAFDSGGSLSHLGLQVNDTDDVLEFRQKWIDEGLITFDEMGVNCCYARQDKTWVSDPDGNEWEAFVVLENLEDHAQNDSCHGSIELTESVEEEKSAASSGCCETEETKVTAVETKRETCCPAN